MKKLDDPQARFRVLGELAARFMQGKRYPGLDDDDVVRSTWQANIEAAEAHNDPGRFTALIAFEYTSNPDGANLHRNVVFSGSEAPELPFGALDSQNPEDLWTWMDQQRARGMEALAIPHNSYASQGRMFQRTNWVGEPIDAGPVEESAYFGQAGVLDGSPQGRGSIPRQGEPGPAFFSKLLESSGASGLAGVWAEENTRESIYAALRRRETFATSGPRIQIRFFAGYGYSDTLAAERDAFEQAYASGVPMGGDLPVQMNESPRFIVWALKDPNEAWLQRAQIVKGWIADGESHERVFDVACSDGLEPDTSTHRCGDNGASVNLADCSTSFDTGAVELARVWSDPTFDPTQRAFYYARVLQNPTCRWSTWDAVRAGVQPSSKVPPTIQERAWSSPIWYTPKL